ncbi:hypothetical protein V5O48_007389 [Marasmius crinis-equi]|uniref:Ricin B lectin domain-containing protein n=1 Tax=Marasmius crinis-equi TaxID=585013 RepID=A0ABR3FGX2_9AGAR
MCITAESNTDGARVALTPCRDHNARSEWVFPAFDDAGPITTSDGTKCLEVPNNDNFNGNALQISGCSGSANQNFVVSSTNRRIKWVGDSTSVGTKNKCVDLTDGNTSTRARIQIWDCGPLFDPNVNQQWDAKNESEL